MFPKVEILEFKKSESSNWSVPYYDTNAFIIAAQSQLKSIRKLKIPEITSTTAAVSFQNLHMLQVGCVESVQGLQNFLSINPSLRELKIERVDRVNAREVLEGIQATNLKTLVFEQVFEIRDHASRVLHSNCPSLREIKVVGRLWVSKANMARSFSSSHKSNNRIQWKN